MDVGLIGIDLMEIIYEKNVISINGKQIFFNTNVRSVLEFSEYCIVLLMDNDIPDNNVVAIDYKGNELWNISQLVKLPYSEAFISLSKESDTSFSVVSYNGVKFVIDILTNQILRKNITK